MRPYGRGAGGATRAGGGAGAGFTDKTARCGMAAGPWVEDDKPLSAVLESGGSVGPATRRGALRRGALPPEPSRRIGEGRAGRSRRCALPTTAFFDTPRRRPISAVDSPSSHSARKRRIVSSAHSISWLPRWCNHKIRYTGRARRQQNNAPGPQKLVENLSINNNS